MKKSIYVFQLLILFLFLNSSENTFAQTPQYYNYNTTNGPNYFPFGRVDGVREQWLVRTGEFNQPSPIPNGFLTKLYIMMSWNNGNVTLTDLTIKLGQTGITTLPPNTLYTGPLDTVYFRSVVTLTSTIGHWMVLTLDKPFGYDNSKSLVIDISQCGATNNSMIVSQTFLSGIRRSYGYNTGCSFPYYDQDVDVLNCGFDIIIPPVQPPYYNNNNGNSNFFPFGVNTGKECQWLIRAGDFIHPSSAPSGYITSLYFYMGSAASTTFNQLLIKLGRTTLTNLPTGVKYTGPLDTVYYRFSVGLLSSNYGWMKINLDKAFYYDNTKSLVIDVSQCTASNSNMSVRQSTGTGLIRNFLNNAVGACAFTYSGQDAQIINAGINLYSISVIPPIGDPIIPSDYLLEQNYPNPFNPTTKIQYDLPTREFVNLSVYDILGREVETLVNEELNPGSYEVEWNASSYPSGVYFYKLTAGEFTNVKKMVLLK